jgi:hypothetical protein
MRLGGVTPSPGSPASLAYDATCIDTRPEEQNIQDYTEFYDCTNSKNCKSIRKTDTNNVTKWCTVVKKGGSIINPDPYYQKYIDQKQQYIELRQSILRQI